MVRIAVRSSAALLLILLLGQELLAQGGGGRGRWEDWEDRVREEIERRRRRRDDDEPPPAPPPANTPPPNNAPPANNPPKPPDQETPKVHWEPTLLDGISKSEGKPILIYVAPASETIDPPAFSVPDAIRQINESFIAVKIVFSKDDPELQSLNAKSAPIVIGADRYGNEFKRFNGRPGTDEIRSLLKQTQDAVALFEKKIKEDWDRANEALSTSNFGGAIPKLMSLSAHQKRGYPEIAEAGAKLATIAQERFSEAQRLLADPAKEREGLTILELMTVWFKGTSTAGEARVKLATHLAARGQVPKAMAWVKPIAADDPSKEAVSRLVADIVDRGFARLRQALASGPDQGLEVTKSAIKQIQADYEGTEVSRQAGEVLKDLTR